MVVTVVGGLMLPCGKGGCPAFVVVCGCACSRSGCGGGCCSGRARRLLRLGVGGSSRTGDGETRVASTLAGRCLGNGRKRRCSSVSAVGSGGDPVVIEVAGDQVDTEP